MRYSHRRARRHSRGQSVLEYLLLIVLAAIAVGSVYLLFADTVQEAPVAETSAAP
ncbi:MAG TPA: hypothetical protein VL027_02715 [Spongiibacteraceae bacterium]|jgi:hypothetical protein|nr:hypothetical protein [Spongiibacteraceae bacterium]HUH36836.1 hypothetical protein [Spongiibacteraceae bacterium]